MSALEVYHPTKHRFYVRRFDHDEARRRIAAGETPRTLADEYGVHPKAIYQVLLSPDERRAILARKRELRTTTCEGCGGPAMKLVGGKAAHNPDGKILCVRCRGIEKTERLRFNALGEVVAVRCSRTACVTGERWQPLDHFPGGVRLKDIRPNGVHPCCRACNTHLRREYRARHREQERAVNRAYRAARRAAARESA